MRQITLGTDAPVSKFCLYLYCKQGERGAGCETGPLIFQLLEKD